MKEINCLVRFKPENNNTLSNENNYKNITHFCMRFYERLEVKKFIGLHLKEFHYINFKIFDFVFLFISPMCIIICISY